MVSVQRSSSGTTWNPVRRGLPVSQKTIVILVGSGVAAVVTVLAVIIVALIRCRMRRRKRKLAIMDGPRSPMDSFIQYPPRPFGTPVAPSDVQFHSHSYTSSSVFTSQTSPGEYLDDPTRKPMLVGPKSSQDSGLGTSSLRISSVSEGGPQKMPLGITPATGSFVNHGHPHVNLMSTYSTTSSPPSQISPAFPSESGERPTTNPSSATSLDSSGRQALISPAPMKEQTLPRHPMSIADSETMSLRSTNTRYTSRSLANPSIRDRNPPPSREFRSFPGLPSSPVATLTLSRSTSEQDLMPVQLPSPPRNPYTVSTFLDSPPRRKLPPRPRSKEHLRSISQSSAPSRLVGQGRPQMETSDSKPSPNYASVAYAREKALQSSRPRAKSVLPPLRTRVLPSTREPINHLRPNVKSHGTSVGTLHRQSQKELLSSRPRSRPRAPSWSVGKDAPERI